MKIKNSYKLIIAISAITIFGCKQDKQYLKSISENIVIENTEDSISLSGTLLLPSEKGIYPAVILISGNGKHKRDAEFGNHKPFLDISNHLSKNGFAVLRYDKRGVGQSTGDYNLATSFDFANDVKSALDYLLTRDDINKQQIGLIGHSEGGLIAPIVASKSSDVAFIISLAGPSLSGDKILLSQQKAIASSKGLSSSEIEKSQKINKEAFDIVKVYKNMDTLKRKMTEYIKNISLNDPEKAENITYEEYVNAQVKGILNPWMINFLRYEPSDFIKNVKCPVLAINGDKDLQVLASQNLPEWKRILENSGNENVTIKEFFNLNHLFQNSETGLPEEYENLNESFSTKVMEEMSIWIKKHI